MQDITLRTTVAVQNFLARLKDDEEGQAAVEYGGILAVIALIFVALFALNLDSTISNAVKDAVNSILGKGRLIHAVRPNLLQARVPGFRPGTLCCVLGLLAALALAAPAAAQDDPAAEDRSVLVILDGSDSMNEQAGDGGTRLDAAKSALRELIDVVPDGAQVGLRVYGNKLSGVSRAKGLPRHEPRHAGRAARQGAVPLRGREPRGQGPHADRPLAAEGARRPRPVGRPHRDPRLRRRRQLRAAAALLGRAQDRRARAEAVDLGRRPAGQRPRPAPARVHRQGGRRDLRRRPGPRGAQARAAGRVRARLPRL